MEQLLDGLFRVLDPRAVLSIILFRFELLQEAEARRSGRVPGSAVLGHAETFLAALRHLITKRKHCSSFLAPESRHRGQASWRRKDSPDRQTARGFERSQRRPGADRRAKLLICRAVEGSILDACSHRREPDRGGTTRYFLTGEAALISARSSPASPEVTKELSWSSARASRGADNSWQDMRSILRCISA